MCFKKKKRKGNFQMDTLFEYKLQYSSSNYTIYPLYILFIYFFWLFMNEERVSQKSKSH